MVLQSSGAISLNDIQTEFGGTNPISTSEYYGATVGIPDSGAISLSNFYGKRRPWEIIMHTSGGKGRVPNHGGSQAFGYTGYSKFKSITASSTGASSRTSFGDGVGLYNSFFTKTGITKLALVSGDGNLDDPTSHTAYIVYDLVSSTGSESLYEIIDRLDTYNINNPNWAADDSLFGSPSVTNFTAGTNGYSGTASLYSSNIKDTSNSTPDKICIWGVNRDNNNDTQVLCAYSGNLQSGKGDDWRGNDLSQSYWSYWGINWHLDSTSYTISARKETEPGTCRGVSDSYYNRWIYLIAM